MNTKGARVEASLEGSTTARLFYIPWVVRSIALSSLAAGGWQSPRSGFLYVSQGTLTEHIALAASMNQGAEKELVLSRHLLHITQKRTHGVSDAISVEPSLFAGLPKACSINLAHIPDSL
jgi:hypothetical protein